MGLDGVEIVIEVEHTFGIRIEDAEAMRMATVGDVVRLVSAKRFAGRPHGCLSATAFRRLRRALQGALGIDRSAVRTDARLEAFLPLTRRRGDWPRVQAALGLSLPPLELSRPLATAIWCAATASGAASGGAAVLGGSGPLLAFALAGAAALGVAGALYASLRRRADRFAARHDTVRGLVGAILSRHYGVLSDERQRWDERELFGVIRDIVSQQLGIAPERVAPDSHFARDLGVD